MRSFGSPAIRLAAAVLLVSMLLLGCGKSDVSRTLGARCESERECDDLCLTGDDFPDGFCSVSCDSDDDCPDDARCVRHQGGRCLFACDRDEDCEFLGDKWECKDESNASGQVCRS